MKASFLLAVVVAGIFGLACESVTPSRIEYWKGSTKGPGKLLAAVSDGELSPKLRAQAAAALADIGMSDMAEAAGGKLPATERWEILKTLIPLLSERLGRGHAAEAGHARDALFGWRRFATPEEMPAIDAALLPVLQRELREGRPSSGRFGVGLMVQSIGVAAAPMLVNLLRDGKADCRVPAELLATVGTQEDRELGGRLLVARASSGRLESDKRDALWAAMGLLGGRSVTVFLSQRLREGRAGDAVRAAQALQLSAAPEVVPLALRMAADSATDPALRDELFQVLARTGGPAAEKGLLDIIATHPADAIRYEAFTTALIIGQASAIEPILDALPAHATYRKNELVERVVQQVVLVEPGVKAALMNALHSRSPVARMVAVLALETSPMARVKNVRLGTPADVPALLRLANDQAVVRGFPPGETVGSEALRVSRLLRQTVGAGEP